MQAICFISIHILAWTPAIFVNGYQIYSLFFGFSQFVHLRAQIQIHNYNWYTLIVLSSPVQDITGRCSEFYLFFLNICLCYVFIRYSTFHLLNAKETFFLQCMVLSMLLELTTILLVASLKLNLGNVLALGFGSQFSSVQHIWTITKLENSWGTKPPITMVIRITWLWRTATISVTTYAASWQETGYQNGWIG